MYLALPLVAFVIHAFLVYIVLKSNPGRFLNRILALFLLSMGLWGFTIYGMRSSTTAVDAFRWEKWVFTWLAAAPAFYFHFTFVFTGSRYRRWMLFLTYGCLGVIILLVYLELIARDMTLRPYGWAPVIGPLFPIYGLYVYGLSALALVNLWKAYGTYVSTAERNRTLYLIVGPVIALLGGATDVMAAIGLPVPPLGIATNVLFGVIATFAVLKGQLLDIQLALRRVLTYAVGLGAVAAFYTFAVIGWRALGGGMELGGASFIIGLSIVITVAFGFQPFLRLVYRLVDRLFYRDRWRPIRELQRFVQETRQITDLHELANSLLGLAAGAMKAKVVYLIGPSQEGGSFSMRYEDLVCHPLEAGVSWDSPLIRWLERQDRAVPFAEIKVLPQWYGLSQQEQKAFEDLGGELYVPLRSKGHLQSQRKLISLLVLGPKIKGKAYSHGDIDLLNTAAYQAATIIENARLYEQLKLQLKELKRTQEQFIRSAKLAAVGELAAGVAHEVNNPLQTILNLTYMLSQDNPPEHMKQDLKLITDEALRARRIVHSLLEFARQKDAVWEQIDVNHMVESVAQLAKVRVKSSIVQVDLDLEADLPQVWGDGEQLKQVLLNLASNALDAMPNGGTLLFRTHKSDKKVMLEVIDTGEGIPKHILPRIFDPFFTTKSSGKGTGLGLALSQDIVERHGGIITVNSEVGKGSTFTVVLPAHTRRERVAKNGERPVASS